MPKAAPLGPTRQCAMFCYLPRVENGDSRKFFHGDSGRNGDGATPKVSLARLIFGTVVLIHL